VSVLPALPADHLVAVERVSVRRQYRRHDLLVRSRVESGRQDVVGADGMLAVQITTRDRQMVQELLDMVGSGAGRITGGRLSVWVTLPAEGEGDQAVATIQLQRHWGPSKVPTQVLAESLARWIVARFPSHLDPSSTQLLIGSREVLQERSAVEACVLALL